MFILRSIYRPGTRIAETAMELAHGNVSAPIPYLANSDAIGQLSYTLTIFRENMLQADRLRKDLEIARRETIQPSIEKIPNAHNLINIDQNDIEKASIDPNNLVNKNIISNISDKITTTSQNASDAFEEVERTEIMVSGLGNTAEKIEDIEVLMIGISDQISLLAVQTTLHTKNDAIDENLVHLYESRDKRKTKITSGSGQSIDDRIKSIQDGTKKVLKEIHNIGATVHSVNEVAREISNTISQEALTAANQLLRQSEDLRTILDKILDKTQNEDASAPKPKI
jgi:methyl-accepting chemotaxis protein